MKKVTIEWIGPDRFVPPYGEFTEGSIRDVSDHHAKSLIKQGLAKEYTPPKAKTKEVKEDV